VSAAALIVAITVVGAVHLRGRSAPPEPPLLPVLLRSSTVDPVGHASTIPAPRPQAPTAKTVPVVSAAPVAAPSSIPSAPRSRGAPPHRLRHVTHPNPAPNQEPPVQYGPDGMPILN
jgi:hypothetical protein